MPCPAVHAPKRGHQVQQAATLLHCCPRRVVLCAAVVHPQHQAAQHGIEAGQQRRHKQRGVQVAGVHRQLVIHQQLHLAVYAVQEGACGAGGGPGRGVFVEGCRRRPPAAWPSSSAVPGASSLRGPCRTLPLAPAPCAPADAPVTASTASTCPSLARDVVSTCGAPRGRAG